MITTDPQEASPRESTENHPLGKYTVEINYYSQPNGRCTITSASLKLIRPHHETKIGLGGLGDFAGKEEARSAALKAAEEKIIEEEKLAS